MLGLFVFFSARQDLAAGEPQEWADQPAGYQVNSDGLDLLDAMWSTDDEDEGVLVEHQQRQQPEQSDRRARDVEDARVDDILARLLRLELGRSSRRRKSPCCSAPASAIAAAPATFARSAR